MRRDDALAMAVREWLRQLELIDYRDPHGQRMKHNAALERVKELLGEPTALPPPGEPPPPAG